MSFRPHYQAEFHYTSGLIGRLNDPATWYGINYTGTQVKGTPTSPARLSFVLKVSLRHLRPTVIYSVKGLYAVHLSLPKPQEGGEARTQPPEGSGPLFRGKYKTWTPGPWTPSVDPGNGPGPSKYGLSPWTGSMDRVRGPPIFTET